MIKETLVPSMIQFALYGGFPRHYFESERGIEPLLNSHIFLQLWLTLADRYIVYRQLDWPATCRTCLNEKTNPDDDKLGVQIVKDLHRTGCSHLTGVYGFQTDVTQQGSPHPENVENALNGIALTLETSVHIT